MAAKDIGPRRKRLIASIAEAVYNDYAKRIPVRPAKIIEDNGIGLTYNNYGDAFDGMIEHKSGKFHIYCNTGAGDSVESPRMRFTQAHELGHYFIDEHRNSLAGGQPPHGSKIDGPGELMVEREANYFASHLLMPGQKLTEFLAGKISGLQTILDAGSTFGVSTQSTAIRFIQDCAKRRAIVMFRENGTSWSEVSPELAASGFPFTQRFRQGPPSGGAAHQAMVFSKKSLSGVVKTTSTATTWFSGVPASSDRNEVITEEAVRLGSRGVLALLTFPALPPAKTAVN